MANTIPPSINERGFTCPFCGINTVHTWHQTYAGSLGTKTPTKSEIYDLVMGEATATTPKEELLELQKRLVDGDIRIERKFVTHKGLKVHNLFLERCHHCGGVSVWKYDAMLYPSEQEIAPNTDLPEPIKRTFIEASRCLSASPRASAALSRLALQELCIELGCNPKKKLDAQIGELVSRGLPDKIQKMLDGVRVVGNNAVHPGQLDLRDDRQIAKFLLVCINRIVEKMITEVREAEELYALLPENTKASIERRDGKNTKPSTPLDTPEAPPAHDAPKPEGP
ncbi:DUF4145 domain-containing protein [uncultured Martelella sp.]|uniref:DUF4145 domain-containing protein n=1 Tax=uncultured Martelella sp. TaxID=392331 RepID=UPI0029C669A4|nr:DUF4145 domain-containing protein [uncultured Martelella sp.]